MGIDAIITGIGAEYKPNVGPSHFMLLLQFVSYYFCIELYCLMLGPNHGSYLKGQNLPGFQIRGGAKIHIAAVFHLRDGCIAVAGELSLDYGMKIAFDYLGHRKETS